MTKPRTLAQAEAAVEVSIKTFTPPKFRKPVVKTRVSYVTVACQLKDIKRARKDIDADKKAIIEPLAAVLTTLRDRYKALDTPLKEKELQHKEAMVEWGDKKQVSAEHDAKFQAAQLQAKGAIEMADDVLANIKADIPSVKGISRKLVPEMVINDPSLIPPNFLIIDKVALRKAVLNGLAVPGVELRSKTSISVKV